MTVNSILQLSVVCSVIVSSHSNRLGEITFVHSVFSDSVCEHVHVLTPTGWVTDLHSWSSFLTGGVDVQQVTHAGGYTEYKFTLVNIFI